ncbi:hypothetical protein J4466_03295 [Candidatus Pacearchaeota archaeon]|nr:hypothetical protein [Candidatus Pacearchaeota archaeon]
MSKKQAIQEMTNILAVALRHKIGSIVNKEEIYAGKYAKDAEVLLKEAKKMAIKENWNIYDKTKIRQELLKKLKKELQEKNFIDDKKFEIMEIEMEKVLINMELT